MTYDGYLIEQSYCHEPVSVKSVSMKINHNRFEQKHTKKPFKINVTINKGHNMNLDWKSKLLSRRGNLSQLIGKHLSSLGGILNARVQWLLFTGVT